MQLEPMAKVTVPKEMWKEQQSVNNWPRAEQISLFWMHLSSELSFRTLLYYQAAKSHCWIEQLLIQSKMTTATLVRNKDSYAPHLKSLYNMNMLGLICLDAGPYESVLSSLSVMLNQMREVPLLLQICSKDRDQPETEGLARQILKRCQELLMPNVLLLLGDFFDTGSLYAYQYFPTFQLLPQVYNPNLTLYPNKLDNMYGHVLLTQPDLSQPYTLVYKDRNGKVIITGVLWKLMKEFARQLNATLQLSFEPTASKSFAGSYFKLMEHALNRTTDITTSLFPINTSKSSTRHMYSYPAFISSWCTMLPVERVMSAREAMRGVLESPWMWLYLGIIYCLIHWLHKRHLSDRPLLMLIPSLMKLTLLCSVVAQLSALFIHPQRLQSITNLEQLNAANLQIMGLRSEFNAYPEEMRIKYASSFISLENYTQFILLRNSFNTSFGYTVFSLKWHIFAELQKHLKRPVFRYSTDFCIRESSLQSLIFQDNSIYRHQLNSHIHWLRQSGLLIFWNRFSFYDMLRAGHYSLKDLGTRVEVSPLSWNECSFIVELYSYAIATSLLVFIFELLVNFINVCLDLI